MGAYDVVTSEAACPRCGKRHAINQQLGFFDPDYHDQVTFRDGVPQSKDVTTSPDWMPIRPHVGPYWQYAIVGGDLGLFRCECGLPIAPVMHFDVEVGKITLERVELRDAVAADLADHVDFADAEWLSAGAGSFSDNLDIALAAAPSVRAALLRSWFFDFFNDDAPRPNFHFTETVYLEGAVSCDACGRSRNLGARTRLAHGDHPSFFGAGFAYGGIAVGQRVPFDGDWLADDVDRGYLIRLRHPIPRLMTILTARQPFVCACGAFRPWTIVRFLRHPGELELESMSMRVIDTPADIADVHFIEAQSTRWSRPAMTRDQIVDELISLSRTDATARS